MTSVIRLCALVLSSLIFLPAPSIAHDETRPERVIEAVGQLAAALNEAGTSLQELPPTDENAELMATILQRASDQLLESAKGLGDIGGDGAADIGLVASALEGASLSYIRGGSAMERAAFYGEAGAAFQNAANFLWEETGNMPRSEAFVPFVEQSENAVYAMSGAADILGAAAIASRKGDSTATQAALRELGLTMSYAGASFAGYAEALNPALVWPWADECDCGKNRWTGRGFQGPNGKSQIWVWQKCVLIKGWVCNTCEWRDRVVRHHGFPGQFEPKPWEKKSKLPGDEEIPPEGDELPDEDVQP